MTLPSTEVEEVEPENEHERTINAWARKKVTWNLGCRLRRVWGGREWRRWKTDFQLDYDDEWCSKQG